MSNLKKILKDPLFWMAALSLAQMLIGVFVSQIIFLCGCLCMLTTFIAQCLRLLYDIRLNQLIQIRDTLMLHKHLLDEQHQANKMLVAMIKNRVRKITFKLNRL